MGIREISLISLICVFLMSCNAAYDNKLELEDSSYGCKSPKNEKVLTFDPRLEKPLLWFGTDGKGLEFTDTQSGERVKILESEGWVCTPVSVEISNVTVNEEDK